PRPSASALFPYTTLFRSGHWLLEQGAVRGAVENAQAAAFIQSQEALAPLFRKDLGDGAIAQLEAAHVFQLGLAVFAAHHEPLAKDRKSTRLNSSHVSISY